MNFKAFLLYSLVPALAMLSSCQPDPVPPNIGTDGKVDLSNYVAIGNSVTAGYASGGLFLEGQKVAYPVLIAGQFSLCGGGEFNAPLFAPEESDGTGYLRLDGFLDASTPILSSVPLDPDAVEGKSADAYSPTLNPDSIVLKPYLGPKNNNLGVPGIKVADIQTAGYGNPNSFFGRMLAKEEKSTATYLQKVIEQKPTVFTCWLGNNDVLGYATAGGYVDLGQITPAAEFSKNYSALMQGLAALPTKPRGALSNVGDITSIPFFTTVTPSVKKSLSLMGKYSIREFKFDSVFQNTILPAFLSDSGKILDTTKVLEWPVHQLASLNSVTGNFDGDVFLTLTFSPYASELGKPSGKAWKDIIHNLVNTFTLPPPYDVYPKEFLEYLAWAKSGLDTTQAFGVSIRNPIPDVFVLNSNESARARNAVSMYNQIIKNQADAYGLAHVDANTFLKNITRGSYFDAISTSASYLSGGAFSLDGVHLTPKGNALAANEFIKAINGKYGTKIPVLNPGRFKGVILP